MSSSGNRSINGGGSGNRQRNLSMASNTSSSSFKDNGANNRRSTESHVTSSRGRIGAMNSSQLTTSVNGTYLRDGRAAANGAFNIGLRRDFQRSRTEYGATSSNGLLDNPCESEQEIQEKLNELQQKKWQYENVMSQLQHLQSSLSGSHSPHIHPSSLPVTRPTELGNIEAAYVPINHRRTTKLQEAQQRLSGSLIQLQDLMQNVSLDLESNPIFSRHNKDKNINPNSAEIKECPYFLRNVATNDGSTMKSPATHLRTNASARQYNSTVSVPRVSTSYHSSPQQNNLSSDSLAPKVHQPVHQVNGFLMDMFVRSDEHSLNSSNEESAGEIEENLLNGDEDEDNLQERHSQDDQIQPGETNARFNIQSRMDSLEQQMERTSSLCELLLVEQRRQSLMMDNLLAAVTQLQCNPATRFGRNPPAHHVVPLSSLPLNSPWQSEVSGGGSSDAQQLSQAVNQCCQLLTQLQRDLTAIQQSSDTSPQSLNPDAALRTPESQQNPFRDTKPRTSQPSLSTYDMDRFDPSGMTLNNRVPPTPRTNNYWDNFRSYSRQNLLSTATSSSKMSTTSTHVPLAQVPHLLPPTSAASLTTSTITTHREQRPPVTRRAKRKVNKGQRQMAIGVHSPHADNRALAGSYGLISGPTVGDNSAFIGRNLNPEADHDDVGMLSTSGGNDSSVNKVVKDTSNLKYSGARPKENRRPVEAPTVMIGQDANVNLMTNREPSDTNPVSVNGSNVGQQSALESIVRSTLSEHAARPQFLAHLLQLLHKFDNDSLRQMALNALQGVADVSREQSELLKVFDAVVANQREFTPALLESFLTTVQHQQQQHQSEEDHDATVEGAAALPQAHSEDQYIYYIRHALTPFLFRRLSQVQELIGDTLVKLESGAFTAQNENTVGAGASSTTTAQEDDLAEADQSCDGAMVDGILDSSPAAASGPEWNEVDVVSSSSNSNRHSVAASGLDEVPTRLMSILNPPPWPRSAQHPSNRSSPTPEDSGQPVRPSSNSNAGRQRNEPECSSSAWFPEDDSV